LIGSRGKPEEEEKEPVVEEQENNKDEKKENEKTAPGNASSNDPHLGPVRSSSGVRCAQPPGGRSTFTLG